MDFAVALHSALLMSALVTDDVRPGLQLGFETRFEQPHWAPTFGIEFRGVFPGTVVARERVNAQLGAPPPPQAFEISQIAISLVPCGRFATYFGVCAVFQGYGFSTPDPGDQQGLVGWGAGPRFTVEIPITEPLSFMAFGETIFTVERAVRPFYASEEAGLGGPYVVWRQEPVSIFFGAGASVKFK